MLFEYCDENGGKHTSTITELPGCSATFSNIFNLTGEPYSTRYAKIGAEDSVLYNAQEILALATNLCTEDPQALLCENSRCLL